MKARNIQRTTRVAGFYSNNFRTAPSFAIGRGGGRGGAGENPIACVPTPAPAPCDDNALGEARPLGVRLGTLSTKYGFLPLALQSR